MRRAGGIARRYAKSLMKLCEDYKYNYDDILSSMKNLLEVLKTDVKLMSLLKSPIVAKKEKISIFSKVFQILKIPGVFHMLLQHPLTHQ
ncbi:MAG: F0F1 ATP synthase subunit delta, partial [Deltaproteobacteria bacterium]|nr:F0F1 ATP synthase subunit delta [Deltaproteobacteria bacterium]